jgi:hypothetical protein
LIISGNKAIEQNSRLLREKNDREAKAAHGAELAKCLNWLSTLDFEERQYDIYHEQRQVGTSTWILRTAEYRRWIGAKNSANYCTLTISGGLGTGKSVAW